MAKQKNRADVFGRLRASGVRKRVVKATSSITGRRGGTSPKQVRAAVKELRLLAEELEDRVRGGPSKREVAAAKGVRTRARNARKRSEAAQRAAKTRAKAKAKAKAKR